MALTKPRAHQLFDIDYKQAVRVLADSDVSLTGGAPSTVDGVVLAVSNRVLVIGQNTASQNGLYQVATVGTGSNGTWIRSQDADTTGELLAGTIVMVTEGTVYADTQWKLVTDNPIVIDVTELNWEPNSTFAFGNIFANGTAVLANTVGDTVAFIASDNISITGNAAAKSVTIGVTGISLNSINNGTSNVNIVTADGNVTAAVNGNTVLTITDTGANVTGYTTVTGNVTGGNIITTGHLTATGNITGGNLRGSTVSGNILNINFAGETRYFDSDDSNYVAFRSASTVAANVIWTLPAADGTVGQVLSTNGSGTLSWSTGGGGGGGLTWTTQANTPPVIAAPGDFWYDSNSQIKYQYVDDGTSNVWVDQSNPTTFASITTGQIVNANANGVGNIGAAGSVFGNVFAGFFVGDGSQLTGLPAGYTDANVTSLLASFGSNTITTTGNITSGNLITSSIAKTGSNGVGNIGSATSTFNVVFARATSALYADLAEMYESDYEYTAGTVVVFGGDQEITQSTESHDTRVAGVVSTNPAFLMNSSINSNLELPVALTGRVPCQVVGPVRKGDLIVSSSIPGVAQRLNNWVPGCVIGKSLDSVEAGQVKKIEIVVGRF